MRSFFSWIANALRALGNIISAGMNWLVNHLWAVIAPIALALKTAYEFCVSLINNIIEKVQAITVPEIGELSITGYLLEGLQFMNSFMPISEFVALVLATVSFWIACMAFRALKGIKETVLF